jgi:hypothetical protein
VKKILTGFILICLITSSTQYSNIINAESGQLLISEIMPNPLGDDSLYEWIEIQNQTTSNHELSKYKINGIQLPSYSITANEIIILAKSPTSILGRYANLTSKLLPFSISLSNSGGTLNLTDNTDTPVQNFAYSSSTEDKSFELLEGGCGTIKINESNSIGRANASCFQTITPTSTVIPSPSSIPYSNYSNLISINSVNPCTSNETIELINNDSFEINLSQWEIEDRSGNAQTLLDNTIKPGQSLLIAINKITLNDTGDLLSLIDPSGNQKDLFVYNKCNNKGDIFTVTVKSVEVSTEVKTPFKPINIQTDGENNLQYPKLYL